LPSACGIASSARPAGRSAKVLALLRRHRFLAAAVLAGPVGSWLLQLAPNVAGLSMPRPGLAWTALLGSILVAPVLEELVFRGGVQEALDRTSWGRRRPVTGLSVGNLATSLIFAAAHLLVVVPWLAAGVFFPSLVFGRLKQLYPSLLPAMLVHAWYNACFLLMPGHP
jgi:membrane protease YdiL (CAAX protease family)